MSCTPPRRTTRWRLEVGWHHTTANLDPTTAIETPIGGVEHNARANNAEPVPHKWIIPKPFIRRASNVVLESPYS